MRITQAHISRSVKFFSEGFRKKYDLVNYIHNDSPLVIFGMYNPEDYDLLARHKQPIVIVWCGSDGLKVNWHRAEVLCLRSDVINIATSSFISNDLKKFNIPHRVLPITPANIDLEPIPRGDALYCYYGSEGAKDFYGYDKAREVADRTGLKCHFTHSKKHTQQQLMNVYRDSFLGLRLTEHDGVSVTAVELGMMGRRCVFNGDTPSAIKWHGVDDICESVMLEYYNRHEDNKQLSEQVKQYLNISESWLHV